MRRLTSTTTDFERPWEKLCFTVFCSTGRFSVRVLGGDTVRVLSPGFFGSVIPMWVLRLQSLSGALSRARQRADLLLAMVLSENARADASDRGKPQPQRHL